MALHFQRVRNVIPEVFVPFHSDLNQSVYGKWLNQIRVLVYSQKEEHHV